MDTDAVFGAERGTALESTGCTQIPGANAFSLVITGPSIASNAIIAGTGFPTGGTLTV